MLRIWFTLQVYWHIGYIGKLELYIKKKVRLAVHNMHTGIMQAFNSMCISKKLDVTVTRETQSFH